MPDLPYGMRAGAYTLELAIVDLLHTWLPTEIVRAARRYAAMAGSPIDTGELEAMMTAGEFPFAPRDITVTGSFDDWPVDALPHIQIIAPQHTTSSADQTGLGVTHELQICCLVGAQTRTDTRFIRACYEDAIPVVVEQHPSLGGIASNSAWAGGGQVSFDGDEKDSRTFQGSIALFDVTLLGVLDPRGGPATPDPPPVVNPGGVPPVGADAPTVVEGGATVELHVEEVD